MTMIINQDATSDHTNADLIEKALIARVTSQCHKNENSSKSASNQSRKCITTIPTNDEEHRNNRVIHSVVMMDAKNGNQDRYHKRQGQRSILQDITRKLDGRNYIHKQI